MRLDTLFY